MRQTWARIETWLRKNVPDELENVRPPASNRDINRLEDITGLRLPPEVEQSYKLHDGFGVGLFLFGDVYGGVLLSIKAVEQDWMRWRDVSQECGFAEMPSEPTGPIKPQHWNLGWLPITDAGNGNCFCVDLDPAEGGAVGQVIWFDRVDGPICVVANGFAAWLEQYAHNLETGLILHDSLEGFIRNQSTNPTHGQPE